MPGFWGGCLPGRGGKTWRAEAQLVRTVPLPPSRTRRGWECVCVWATPTGAVFWPLLLLQPPAPAGRQQGLAQGPRERSQFPLNPGTGDERFWGCCVTCYLSREHRDGPGIWVIGPRVPNVKVPQRRASGGPTALCTSSIALMWPRASSWSQRGRVPTEAREPGAQQAQPLAGERQTGGAGGSAGWCWEGRSELLDSGWRENRMA